MVSYPRDGLPAPSQHRLEAGGEMYGSAHYGDISREARSTHIYVTSGGAERIDLADVASGNMYGVEQTH
jgi:hypothetical protein